MEQNQEIKTLKEELAQHKEELFLAKTDLQACQTQNIAMKNFIQNLYESCELGDQEIELSDVLNNLKKNIRVFARDHNIRI